MLCFAFWWPLVVLFWFHLGIPLNEFSVSYSILFSILLLDGGPSSFIIKATAIWRVYF